jgi:hypothetical protein
MLGWTIHTDPSGGAVGLDDHGGDRGFAAEPCIVERDESLAG